MSDEGIFKFTNYERVQLTIDSLKEMVYALENLARKEGSDAKKYELKLLDLQGNTIKEIPIEWIDAIKETRDKIEYCKGEAEKWRRCISIVEWIQRMMEDYCNEDWEFYYINC